MIEINLLPKELRKKKKVAFKMPEVNVKILPIGIGFFAILILTQLALGMAISSKTKAFESLNEEWNKIFPEKREVDALKKEVNEIERKVDIIDQLIVKRTLWSRKLSDLSNSMISGIWLTKLSLQKNKQLNIEGNAYSSYGDETAVVGRFIKSLKENEDFFSDFSKIELGQIQRRSIKDAEVMRFVISCYFKRTGANIKGIELPRELNPLDMPFGGKRP